MPTDLDKPLSVDEFAELFGVSAGFLRADAKKLYPIFPVMRLGTKLLRYHPRTVLAEFARRAKVAPETIAASYGTNLTAPSPFISQPADAGIQSQQRKD